MNKIIILLILIFTCCLLVFSLGLIIFSFVINGGYISVDEIMEIIVFCFKLFSLGSPLILLSIFISNKIRKQHTVVKQVICLMIMKEYKKIYWGGVMKIKLLLQYVIFWLIIFLICFTSSTLIFSLLELLLKLDNYSFSDFKKMASFWLNGSAAMATLVLIIEAKNKRW